MEKFGRDFRLTIDPKDGLPPILITMPFTVRFWVERNIMADINRFSIDIYNLSEDNRRRIFQDRFDLRQKIVNGENQGNRTVKFEAGYSILNLIFSGRIYEASSARAGTEIVTRIEARDGDYDVHAAQTFQTLQSGQTVGDVLKFLIGQFPNLATGAVGNFPDKINRPIVLNGSTWNLLKQYSGDKVYIDNGKVYCLQRNEVLDTPVTQITDATGLLETPRRDEGYLTLTTLMETSVGINQLIDLQSTVNPVYNGQYSVIGLKHEGTISAAVCGMARSTFNLLHPDSFTFTQVQAAA